VRGAGQEKEREQLEQDRLRAGGSHRLNTASNPSANTRTNEFAGL